MPTSLPDPKALVASITDSLWQDILDPWFPRCVDAERGYHQHFAADWSRIPSDERSIVFQSRMLWVSSTVAEMGHPEFLPYAEKGWRELSETLIDRESGGFRWDNGANRDAFHAYGVSFAIYALAAYYRVTRDTAVLAAAQNAFWYLEEKHHDDEHGGYWETPGGIPAANRDLIGTPAGQKSQNTHLHLLEAFSELLPLWPHVPLRNRLAELLDIFLTRFYVAPGWLHTEVQFDWTPVDGSVSYGHDIEATHLLLTAAHLLENQDPTVHLVAETITDYALQHGWDPARGGFFNSGTPAGVINDRRKIWWVQAEGLLALATLWNSTNRHAYGVALADQWDCIQRYQIDSQHRGWNEFDDEPQRDKGHAWKEAYHESRALIHVIRRLNERTGH